MPQKGRKWFPMAAAQHQKHKVTIDSLWMCGTFTRFTQSHLTQHFHFMAFCLQGRQTFRVLQPIKPTVLNSLLFSGIQVNHYSFLNSLLILKYLSSWPIYPRALVEYIHHFTLKDFLQFFFFILPSLSCKVMADAIRHVSHPSSVLYPHLLVFSHHPPATSASSISYFLACMLLWPYKAGTVGCRVSDVCLGDIDPLRAWKRKNIFCSFKDLLLLF